jgi:uncharacterized protein (TIGR02145 family)
VPNDKATGVYTYVRQSKSAECPDWQSSNEFTVTVFNCSFSAGTETGATATFTDARDGKQYKTVVMPDGRTWFAQNLNYTKDLTFNKYSYEANGKPFTSTENAVPAIGSYWCPGEDDSNVSGSEVSCNTLGALYTWETVMMVDGKYADETKTSSAWEESWVSPYYYSSGAIGSTPNADKNNARGGTYTHGGGRGICPLGWHIPTIREITQLLDKVNGDGTASSYSSGADYTSSTVTDTGIKLRSSLTYSAENPAPGSWRPHLYSGIDLYQFNLLACGERRRAEHFKWQHQATALHSSTVAAQGTPWRVGFWYNIPYAALNGDIKVIGDSVRCIKD